MDKEYLNKRIEENELAQEGIDASYNASLYGFVDDPFFFAGSRITLLSDEIRKNYNGEIDAHNEYILDGAATYLDRYTNKLWGYIYGNTMTPIFSKNKIVPKAPHLPIYSTYKLIDGSKKYKNIDHDISNHLTEGGNGYGSTESELLIQEIRFREKKSDDAAVHIGANVLGLFADVLSGGMTGSFVRTFYTDAVLDNQLMRLKLDKEYLDTDLHYRMQRYNGTAFDINNTLTSEMLSSTMVTLNYEKVLQFQENTGVSNNLLKDMLATMSQNFHVSEYEEQLELLDIAINTYPDVHPKELLEILIKDKKKIKKTYNNQNNISLVNDIHSYGQFSVRDFIENSEFDNKKSKKEIALSIVGKSIQKKNELQDLQTGDDLRREKKYNRDIAQQKISDSISDEMLLKEKHNIKNNELARNRTVSTQEFEWMYDEIITRLKNEIKAAQLTQ